MLHAKVPERREQLLDTVEALLEACAGYEDVDHFLGVSIPLAVSRPQSGSRST